MNANVAVAQTHRVSRGVDEGSDRIDQRLAVECVVVASLDVAEPLDASPSQTLLSFPPSPL